jgi:hypothetical protein
MWQRQNHLPNKKNRQYLDAFALRSSSVPNLSQDVSSKYLRDGFTQHPPQTKQAWGAKEENPKGKTVIPFRRPGGRKAPHGVPKLDLSVLGLNRDVFEPIVLLEDDSPSSQTSPVDATVEETTKKEVVGDEDDVPSSPQQPKFVPSFEAAKKKVVISESQDRRYTPQPGSTDLLRKVEFKCFMVTRSGRDIHRDLTGYFFPSDNTLAVYEVKQLAKKPSAFALFERKSYSHLNGKLKGMCYTLGDISEGRELNLDPMGQRSLPESLLRQTSIHLRITQVDLQAKNDHMFKGKSILERISMEKSLADSLEEQQKENSNVRAVQGAVTHRLRGRATRTLVGLGRYLRQEEERARVGGIPLRVVQQGLRSYHIGITPEDLNILWSVMDPDQSGLTSEQQAVRSLIGGMNHTRKMAVINLFRKLDLAKTGYLKLSELKRYFQPMFHPDVISKKKSEEEAWLEITNLLVTSRGGKRVLPSVQLIPWADFEDYFEGQSIDYPDDHQFSVCVKKVWGEGL